MLSYPDPNPVAAGEATEEARVQGDHGGDRPAAPGVGGGEERRQGREQRAHRRPRDRRRGRRRQRRGGERWRQAGLDLL